MKLFVILMTALSLVLLLQVNPAFAERLESDSYVIQFGNFNVTAGEKEGGGYKVTDTVGQTGAGPYGEYGSSTYFVGGGFQYIYQIQDFSFTISKLNIDLGTLSPGVHNTDSHTITITTRGAGGYTVYAFEEHPLEHESVAAEIPDTTCDNSDCDEITATTWSNQDVPGFGFNMSGDNIPADFSSSNHYRQFADDSNNEAMQAVMSSTDIAAGDQATVTYKAGISGSQASGRYNTAVVFVAVPGY